MVEQRTHDGACRQAAALVYIDHHISFHRLTSSNSVLSPDDHCISVDKGRIIPSASSVFERGRRLALARRSLGLGMTLSYLVVVAHKLIFSKKRRNIPAIKRRR